MRNFRGVEHQSESTFLFFYIVIFQRWASFEAVAPLFWEINICAGWLFCSKFNMEKHLFEPFFDAMRIFGSVEPQSESTFPFFYITIFQRWVYFEPPSSTLGGDRHMRSWTFLYEIQLRTTFIRSFFWCDAYFWQCSVVNAKMCVFSINHNVNSNANDPGPIFYDKFDRYRCQEYKSKKQILTWELFQNFYTKCVSSVVCSFTLLGVWIRYIACWCKTGLPWYLFYRKTCKAATYMTYSIVEIAIFQLFFQL